MARKSRKEVPVKAQEEQKDIMYTDLKPLTEFSVYRAGLYARLSFESEGNRDRGTIETQMQLCRKFVDCQEDIVVQREYFDISETGTNFDRAGFEEMIEDVKKGVINCIIVKDLSRLGRNYIEAGNYVERVFPFYGIRFIAVTDSVVNVVDNLRYTGDDVHNQYYNNYIGEKVQRLNDESEWIIRPNNHEAIVSREIFETVAKIRKKRAEKAKVKENPGMYSARNVNFFKRKIFCKECGGPMYCCRHNKAVRYFCSAKILKKDCNPKYIPDTTINDEVLRVVHTHINVYTDNVEMIRRLNGKKENCLQFEVFSKEVRRLQRELDKITAMKNDLYEDYVAHLIDAEQYLTIKAENLEKEAKLKASLEEMLVEKNRVSVNYKTNEEWDALINSIRDKRILTKKMVDALVSRVVVDRNFNIEVELVYDDMLKDLANIPHHFISIKQQ